MRVITGSAKGRRLLVPRGLKIRPTADRVKESLFGLLGGRIPDSRFLDLYAGTGSIGIEALSRGARIAVFVDDSKVCVETIRRNLNLTGLAHQAQVYRNDADRAITMLGRRGMVFDLIFLDPPYGKDLVAGTLIKIAGSKTLAPGGYVIAEHTRREETPEGTDGLRLVRQERFGETMVSIYTAGDSNEKGNVS